MFYRCSSLNSLNLSCFNISKVNNTETMFAESLLNYLDLSSFNMSKINSIYRMFYGSKLEYVNFKIAKINADEAQISNDLFSGNYLNSIIACENDNDFLLGFFKEKKFIYCNNNYSYHQIKYLGYMMNSTKYNKYTCDICGKNFYNKYRIINENNNSYIDCFELINDNYLDENDWNYKSCYFTCKSCEIGGNEINHNCLLCKDDFLNQSSILNSNFTNCYKLNLNELIKNTTELKQDIFYNSNTEFNINDIISGTNNKINNENIIIKLTSTNNQKNNETLNDITI